MHDIKGGYGISLWKEIKNEREIFLPHAMFSIGDGRRVCF